MGFRIGTYIGPYANLISTYGDPYAKRTSPYIDPCANLIGPYIDPYAKSDRPLWDLGGGLRPRPGPPPGAAGEGDRRLCGFG